MLSSVLPEYARRLINYRQMDIESTLWQMFYLCVNPKNVYNRTKFHKQTKNQWARDDPAFVAVLVWCLLEWIVTVTLFAFLDCFGRFC